MERSAIGCVVGVLMLAGGVAPARAQTGGGYDLSHNVIAGGGATFSTSGNLRLGGTAGQADAGRLTGPPYSVSGGFWGTFLSASTATPTPKATPTSTPMNTATLAPTPIASVTATPMSHNTQTPASTSAATATVTLRPSITATATQPATPSPTTTATGTPSVTPTLAAIACVGDCNGDGSVTVDEILSMVNLALGNPSTCPDGIAFGVVPDVALIIQAVTNALNGCGG